MGRRGMFIGSPRFIRDNIRQYEAAHVDILNLFSQCGDRKHEDIMASLELFAKEVMPEFKERHPQHQKWRGEEAATKKVPVDSYASNAAPVEGTPRRHPQNSPIHTF